MSSSHQQARLFLATRNCVCGMPVHAETMTVWPFQAPVPMYDVSSHPQFAETGFGETDFPVGYMFSTGRLRSTSSLNMANMPECATKSIITEVYIE